MFLLVMALNAAVVVAPSAAEYTIVRGSVVVAKTSSHEIVVAVDACASTGAGDRFVDHLFRFWTVDEAPALTLSSRAATVEYRGDELVVIAADRQTFLTFDIGGNARAPRAPAGFTSTQLRGLGLNHEMGPAVNRKTMVVDHSGELTLSSIFNPDYGDGGGTGGGTICDSGGVGSTSCSLTNSAGSCSTSCASGFYACCNYGSENTCKCIKN